MKDESWIPARSMREGRGQVREGRGERFLGLRPRNDTAGGRLGSRVGGNDGGLGIGMGIVAAHGDE